MSIIRGSPVYVSVGVQWEGNVVLAADKRWVVVFPPPGVWLTQSPS